MVSAGAQLILAECAARGCNFHDLADYAAIQINDTHPSICLLYTSKKDYEIHELVQQVYDALKEKGYNPVNQLVGYILSEDPTYITTYKNARAMIRKVDRDDLLQAMLRSYLNV